MAFIFTLFATLYALDFDLRFPEHLVFPIYPILLILAFWLNRPTSTLLSLLTTFFVFFTLYFLFLALNILNVATVRTVPLKKAALSTFYFLGFIIGFFNIKGFLILSPSPFLLLASYFLLSLMLIFPLVYIIQIKPKLMFLEVLVLAFLSAETGLMVSFLKVSPIVSSVFLTGTLFLLIGLMQNVISKTLTKKILREHIAVGGALVGILLIGSLVV